MDEFERVIRELKQNDFAVELSEGTMVRAKGYTTEIILSKILENNEYFTDAMAAVRKLDKAGAMLLIQGNVWGVYAECISKSAADMLEYYGIEFEYQEQVEEIYGGECILPGGKKISFEELVRETEDPMEALEILEQNYNNI